MKKRKHFWGGALWRAAIILLCGVVLGITCHVVVDRLYRAYLVSRVTTIAVALDETKIAQLKRSLDNKTAIIYTETRAKLAAIREANPDIRFVYIMAQDRNSVHFIADSEPETSVDHSTYGEQYNDASADLIALFKNKRAFTEGPARDDWGTWLSALAPIIDPQTKQVLAVVGLDVPATQYTAFIAIATATPIAGAVVMVAFMIVGNLVRRRRLKVLRFRSELVSIASHELRTPLIGIRWASETFLRDTLSKQQRILAESIHRSALHLQESIEDILQLASLQNASHALQRAPTNMRAVFEDIFVTQKLPAEQRGISFVFENDWPELTLFCDTARIKRVFNNVISNALKYSKDNGKIRVAYKKVVDGHCFTVADQGIGIPKNEQHKVFDGFYRASNALQSDVAGTGMGLYLSRVIVEQHGGAMRIESEEGKGTVVYIVLPFSDTEVRKK